TTSCSVWKSLSVAGGMARASSRFLDPAEFPPAPPEAQDANEPPPPLAGEGAWGSSVRLEVDRGDEQRRVVGRHPADDDDAAVHRLELGVGELGRRDRGKGLVGGKGALLRGHRRLLSLRRATRWSASLDRGDSTRVRFARR